MRDDTRGLLFSGCVCLQNVFGRAAVIRCRLKEGEYDAAPVLYKIFFNMVRAKQRNTICCGETAKIPQGGGRVALESYLARTGSIRVLRQLRGDLWKDITADCGIDPPITADRRERYVYFPRKGTFKIICTVPGAAGQNMSYPVTGVAGQQIDLPWDNIRHDATELMLGRGDGLYCVYRREDAWEDRIANAWHWQEGGSRIVLGDGRHGDIPPACGEGLLFTSLVLWEGKSGNVSIGRIGKLEREDLFPGISCTNLMAGRGGLDYQNPSEQFLELKENFPQIGRMVTEDDIRRLVMQTPGLRIGDVEAQWGNGEVEVSVFPARPLKSDYLVQFYINRITEFLEPYRLAGSRFRVVIT